MALGRLQLTSSTPLIWDIILLSHLRTQPTTRSTLTRATRSLPIISLLLAQFFANAHVRDIVTNCRAHITKIKTFDSQSQQINDHVHIEEHDDMVTKYDAR